MREYQRATEAHDVQAVIALFAPDIVVRSPITERIRFEGIAERMLSIDGKWEDHARYSITLEEWDERGPELVKTWLED